MRDYLRWHDDYADPNSNLSARLRRVRSLIAAELAARPGPIRLLSLCAGDGRDILGVLDEKPADVPRLTGRLVELSPQLADAADAHVHALGSPLQALQADAGDPQNVLGAIPADLVLLVGIMGNISDDDVLHLVGAAASLCAPHAYLIWTRGGQYADLNTRIDARLAAAGFTDRQFLTEPAHQYGIGTARWPDQRPPPLPLDRRLFTFVR